MGFGWVRIQIEKGKRWGWVTSLESPLDSSLSLVSQSRRIESDPQVARDGFARAMGSCACQAFVDRLDGFNGHWNSPEDLGHQKLLSSVKGHQYSSIIMASLA